MTDPIPYVNCQKLISRNSGRRKADSPSSWEQRHRAAKRAAARKGAAAAKIQAAYRGLQARRFAIKHKVEQKARAAARAAKERGAYKSKAMRMDEYIARGAKGGKLGGKVFGL